MIPKGSICSFLFRVCATRPADYLQSESAKSNKIVRALLSKTLRVKDRAPACPCEGTVIIAQYCVLT